MSYYSALSLTKEPFSTSPDPAFLYRSTEHESVLKRLEIAIRLKRGLSLILGDVGTGKTTISRVLLREFADDQKFLFHIMLNPTYRTEFEFLKKLASLFGINPPERTVFSYKEEIERYLFRKGVEEDKTIVLLVDEGQNLSTNFLEILRMLLNYETNEHKLLQLVILSQSELLPKIKKIRNFYDRIILKYVLNPLDEASTYEMIDFRLREAGLEPKRRLFNDDSLKMVYEYSQGYPRKVAQFCHDALEELVMTRKGVVDREVMETVLKRENV